MKIIGFVSGTGMMVFVQQYPLLDYSIQILKEFVQIWDKHDLDLSIVIAVFMALIFGK
jgi:MFS superfamily sulfate permease-like transporter